MILQLKPCPFSMCNDIIFTYKGIWCCDYHLGFFCLDTTLLAPKVLLRPSWNFSSFSYAFFPLLSVLLYNFVLFYFVWKWQSPLSGMQSWFSDKFYYIIPLPVETATNFRVTWNYCLLFREGVSYYHCIAFALHATADWWLQVIKWFLFSMCNDLLQNTMLIITWLTWAVLCNAEECTNSAGLLWCTYLRYWIDHSSLEKNLTNFELLEVMIAQIFQAAFHSSSLALVLTLPYNKGFDFQL